VIPPNKVCPKCNIEKPSSDFHKERANKDGLHYMCKLCNSERSKKRYRENREKINRYHKEWTKDNKDIIRNGSYQRLYGISLDDYNEMLEEQNNSCYICEDDSQSPLFVDHCHSNGKVRGLLCKKCNSALSFFKEDPRILERAIDYLRR
jgi:hypothetical protein